MLPTMLFSGFMSNLDNIVNWLVWLQYLSPLRYCVEILFRNEYRKIDFIDNGDPLNPYPVEGFNLNMGMRTAFICLFLVGFGFQIAAFFFLKSQTISV